MNPMSIEGGAGETAPLRDGSRTSGYLSLGAASQTFGSRYFLL